MNRTDIDKISTIIREIDWLHLVADYASKVKTNGYGEYASEPFIKDVKAVAATRRINLINRLKSEYNVTYNTYGG